MKKSNGRSGLDGRHRNVDGRIDKKHGNTLVGTLRETYGQDFASDFRSDAKLATILRETGHGSLSEILKGDR
jgi:hypothetical protein